MLFGSVCFEVKYYNRSCFAFWLKIALAVQGHLWFHTASVDDLIMALNSIVGLLTGITFIYLDTYRHFNNIFITYEYGPPVYTFVPSSQCFVIFIAKTIHSLCSIHASVFMLCHVCCLYYVSIDVMLFS